MLGHQGDGANPVTAFVVAFPSGNVRLLEVVGAPDYRQCFVLEILRHEEKEEPLFKITRCMAVGWMLEAREVEKEWMERTLDSVSE